MILHIVICQFIQSQLKRESPITNNKHNFNQMKATCYSFKPTDY